MGVLAKLGIGGVLGLLLGFLVVAWVRPATQAGQALLVLVSVAVVSALYTFLRSFIGKGGD